MRTDWMPSTRPAQLAMAKRWLDLLPGKETAWRIPTGVVQRLDVLTQDAEDLMDRANGPLDTQLSTPTGVWMNKGFTAWRTQQRNAPRSGVNELMLNVVAQRNVTG